LQSYEVLEAMQHDSGKQIHELRVDGGATRDTFLMQYQADILGIPVLLPEVTESTALGAAYLAGITGKVYNTIDDVAKFNKIAKRFNPSMNESERKREISLWKDAVKRLL